MRASCSRRGDRVAVFRFAVSGARSALQPPGVAAVSAVFVPCVTAAEQATRANGYVWYGMKLLESPFPLSERGFECAHTVPAKILSSAYRTLQ